MIGWIEVDGELTTKWFEGAPLPSGEEYDKHIDSLMHHAVGDIEEEISAASDSESEAEYPLSGDESSSDETDDNDDTDT